MIGTSVVASVLLILVLVSGAPAFNEPDGFRGVPWGASQEQVRTTLDFSRQNREDCTEITRDCQDLFWLGDIPLRTIYRFRNGRLTGVFLHFKSRESAKLAAILVERYGAATKEKREQFKTRGGVTASNQHLRWEGPKVVIDFWQFMGTLDEGLTTILTREEIEALDREVQEQTKDAAKGL
jgi:hypothetical protein